MLLVYAGQVNELTWISVSEPTRAIGRSHHCLVALHATELPTPITSAPPTASKPVGSPIGHFHFRTASGANIFGVVGSGGPSLLACQPVRAMVPASSPGRLPDQGGSVARRPPTLRLYPPQLHCGPRPCKGCAYFEHRTLRHSCQLGGIFPPMPSCHALVSRSDAGGDQITPCRVTPAGQSPST